MFKTRAVKTRAIRLILTCSARARGILAVVEVVVHDEAREIVPVGGGKSRNHHFWKNLRVGTPGGFMRGAFLFNFDASKYLG